MSFLSCRQKVCKLVSGKNIYKDVGLPRAEKRNGHKGVLFK